MYSMCCARTAALQGREEKRKWIQKGVSCRINALCEKKRSSRRPRTQEASQNRHNLLPKHLWKEKMSFSTRNGAQRDWIENKQRNKCEKRAKNDPKLSKNRATERPGAPKPTKMRKNTFFSQNHEKLAYRLRVSTISKKKQRIAWEWATSKKSYTVKTIVLKSQLCSLSNDTLTFESHFRETSRHGEAPGHDFGSAADGPGLP